MRYLIIRCKFCAPHHMCKSALGWAGAERRARHQLLFSNLRRRSPNWALTKRLKRTATQLAGDSQTLHGVCWRFVKFFRESSETSNFNSVKDSVWHWIFKSVFSEGIFAVFKRMVRIIFYFLDFCECFLKTIFRRIYYDDFYLDLCHFHGIFVGLFGDIFVSIFSGKFANVFQVIFQLFIV